MQSPLMIQVCFDLVLALSVCAYFIYRDAKQRGIAPLPYVALTLGTGSFGPLLYLLRRGNNEPEHRVQIAVAQ